MLKEVIKNWNGKSLPGVPTNCLSCNCGIMARVCHQVKRLRPRVRFWLGGRATATAVKEAKANIFDPIVGSTDGSVILPLRRNKKSQ